MTAHVRFAALAAITILALVVACDVPAGSEVAVDGAGACAGACAAKGRHRARRAAAATSASPRALRGKARKPAPSLDPCG